MGAGRDGSTFEQILQILVVVVAQSAGGPRADAWYGNGVVSAAVPPARPRESDQSKEYDEFGSEFAMGLRPTHGDESALPRFIDSKRVATRLSTDIRTRDFHRKKR